MNALASLGVRVRLHGAGSSLQSRIRQRLGGKHKALQAIPRGHATPDIEGPLVWPHKQGRSRLRATAHRGSS